MKIRATLCFAILFFHSLAAQKRATAPTLFTETFSTQTATLFRKNTGLYQHYRTQQAAAKANERYLIIVTLDGFRWQEVFMGADSVLISDTVYTPDTATYKDCYWAATSTQRRQLLLPFLWKILANQGQLHGNRTLGNYVNVANKMWFSYPGYNEMFTGKPDDAHIFTNLKLPNPNENVLECLNRQKGLCGRIAAFTSWTAFPAILNEKRAHIPVNSGNENRTENTVAITRSYYEQLKSGRKTAWPKEECFDALTQTAACDYLLTHHPRVAYIGLGDTDEAAHAGHYDRYLDAAHEADQWLAELWKFLQNDLTYRGRTTLLLTTDHGRGYQPARQWCHHHAAITGADQIWLAAIGPDTPPLGELQQPAQLYQQQLASTIAQLVSGTFQPSHEVAPAVESIFRKTANGRLITARN